ncbi:hypothetical protein B9Z55_008354 [Caenorhabditis nigoni]|uniref:Uncharacterized protein n=1 Tax=Caenorhabditis nigoni TaxID=1611254 RepID=A0A2G5UME2_9PELO|nr:hypothetical protein B9Z55_008354 [Caenorhabditis nigoni]
MDNYSLLSSEDHMEMRNFSAGADAQRRESQGSAVGETRVQFALSQTPPVETVIASGPTLPRHQHSTGISNTSATTHHTLSPVIQCFQNDNDKSSMEDDMVHLLAQ